MGRRRSSNAARSGVLLIDKPEGHTSHDAVAVVRRAFGQREVGHTGTLDPLATGLLVLALGKATRLARFIEATEKTYEGTITLGVATETFDREGRVTEEAPVDHLDAEAVERALAGCVGPLALPVPMYSAVKVGGERLYAKARRDEVVETPVREITIHALERTGGAGAEVAFRAVVSKGTYIRSLAVEVGRRLGVPAHLSALRRTRVGAFDVADAHALGALEGGPELRPLDDALAGFPRLTLPEAGRGALLHGHPMTAARLEAWGVTVPPGPVGAPVVLAGPAGEPWAVMTRGEGGLDYAVVLLERGPLPSR